MTSRIKRTLIVAGVLLAIGLCVAGWATVRVVAFFRELPSRIVIDDVAVGNTITEAVIDGYHQSLRDGDAETQRKILEEHFPFAINEDANARKWIRSEYYEDILALVDASDSEVSAAASKLIVIFDAADDPSTARTDE